MKNPAVAHGWLVVLALAPSGCGDSEFRVEAVDIALEPSVDVRLEAVTAEMGLYVLGSGGLVVGQDRGAWDLDHRLHDIIDVASDCLGDGYLIVVGDEGYVALSDDLLAEDTLEFEVQTTPTTADLWAVDGHCDHDLSAVAVGDEILLVGREDPQGGYQWTEPTPPPDGWGRLRDVGWDRFFDRVCAIGDAGRVICSEDLELWERVELDTTANLTALCAGGSWAFAVGEAGTLVREISDDWSVTQLEPALDMIGCTTWLYYLIVVGDDRRVYVEGEPQIELDWQPRAIDPQYGLTVVGDGGKVAKIELFSGLVPQ